MANDGYKTYAARRSDPRVRIMVVDDERVIADTLVAILRTSGYAAEAAYNAEAALAACDEAAPELLISDVCMPGMNGVALAIAVRQRYPQCLVLLFSGHASSASLLAEARLQGYDFELLSKPIHPRDLIERLRRLEGHGVGSPELLRKAV